MVVGEADEVDDGRSLSIPWASIAMPTVTDVSVELVGAGGAALGKGATGFAPNSSGRGPAAAPGDFAAVGVADGSTVFGSLFHVVSSLARAA